MSETYEMALDVAVENNIERAYLVRAYERVFDVKATEDANSPTGWPMYTFTGARDALVLLAKAHLRDPDIDAGEEGWIFVADRDLTVEELETFRPMADPGLRDGGADGTGRAWRLSDLSSGEREKLSRMEAFGAAIS